MTNHKQTKPTIAIMKKLTRYYPLASAIIVTGFTCLTARVEASISVGPAPTGTGTNTFDVTPAVTNWSTLSVTNTGGAGAFTTAVALDADVIANVNAASITTALGTSGTLPLTANVIARHNTGTAGKWLQTCPTTVTYNVLLATLQNNSGAGLVGLDVSYDFGNNLAAGTTLAEEIPGHRVFYSQTGAPGSWSLAAALSTGTTGLVSGTLNLGTWAKSAFLYILWVDDNAAADRNNSGTEEGGYTIDNWRAVGVLPPRPQDLSFQEGVDGYAGTQDTYVWGGNPDTIFGGGGTFNSDSSDGGGAIHGLIRFDNIFGAAMNQIPPGALIRSASLTVRVSNAGPGNDVNLHRMLAPWSQVDATWNTMGGDGVLADDVEAAITSDATFQATATGTLVIPLSVASLQAWSDGTNNYGWALLPGGSDGVDMYSSEVATLADHPKLMVSWGAAGEPSIKAFTGTAVGFTMVLEDGNPPGDVIVGTVAATFNGSPVTAPASKVGTVTTVTYTAPALLAAGSTNAVSVTLKHSASQTTMVIGRTYVVAPYKILPASLAVTGVDTSKPGFRVGPYQTDGNDPNGRQPNTMAWTEDQLLGLHGANLADLSGADASGSYTNLTVLNYNIEAGTLERGNFTNDVFFPGIPGTTFMTGNSSMEVLTFLNFPVAGAYRFGVSSDDGFRVTAGRNPRDRFSLILGEFDDDRGVADTLFDVVVEQAGYYAIRLIWENGDGELTGNGASCEWFTVAADGTKILINDLANPNAIRAYYAGPMSAYVKWLNPRPGAVDVPVATTIDFLLADGTTSTVNLIQLWFNGSSVTPTINKPAGTNVTTVTYDPPGNLAPEATNTVRLVFGDNGTPAYSATNDYQFVTAPTGISLVAINDTTLWRYENTGTDLGTAWKEKSYPAESTWATGAACIGVEPDVYLNTNVMVGSGEKLRTDLAGVYSQAIITYYFRIQFNWSGPAGVRLRLRHVVDDGAVFYLNGTEVHRFGLAAGATVNYLTGFTGHENQYEGPFLIPTASLVQGDNVLAVEVHQSGSTSTDVVLGAVLDALTSYLARTTIESVTPAPNAVDVPRESIIGLTLVDGTQKVQTNSVRLWVNDGAVTPLVNKPLGSTVTTVSYNPGTSLPYGTAVKVKLQFTDDGPVPNVTTYEWSYTTKVETIVLFAINDTTLWRYINDGSDQGVAWRATAFADSTWPEDKALLALESGATIEPIRTALVRNGIVTDYFRTHFNWSGSLAGVNLRLRLVVDDAAVCYLNGVEVNRSDLIPPGPVNYLTVALTDHEGRDHYDGPFVISTTNLVAGDNVFAVEVHQNAASSSDVVFGAELTAVRVPAPNFTSARLEGGGLRIEWTGTGTLERADFVKGPWTTAPSQTNPQIVPTTGAAGFHRIKQ